MVPTPRPGHFFASVPRDPLTRIRTALENAGLGFTTVEQAIVTARAASNAALLCEVCAALSDHHLERGELQDARAFVFEALIASTANNLHLDELERQDAWLDYLTARPEADKRLWAAFERAKQHDDAFEVAVLSLYLGLVRARSGDHPDTVHPLISSGMAMLRDLGDTRTLTRLALIAALAYGDAGDPDLAIIEILRVRAWADNHDDAPLKAAADALMEKLETHRTADRRVHHLVSVAIEVGRQRKLTDVLRTVVCSTLDLLGADRAFVVRRGADGAEVVASKSRHGEPGRPSMSIVRRALEEGREVVAADVGEDAGLGSAKSIMEMGLRTALCVPMTDGPTVIGAIYADSTQVSSEELHDAAWLIRAFAAHAVAAVRNAEHNHRTERRMLRAKETNHDVHNLISTLRMGLGELQDDAQLPPWAAEVVGELKKVTTLIQHQVDQSLSETREPAEPLALDALVNRVAEFMRFDGRKNDVGISVKTTPTKVKAREGDLTRLVANLVGNAVKYSPQGSTVEIELTQEDGFAHLSVHDHGPGVPSAELEAIFQSGVQASGHRAGKGLGLGICRRLASEAGGEVWAENVADGGAAFMVQLPLHG